MNSSVRVCVVGAGIFGISSAISLSRRGYGVYLFERDSVANPLAASTDISKVVRMEYGPDRVYMQLGEKARRGWLEWNKKWTYDGLSALYHDSGVLMCCRDPMSPGGFEYESHALLLEHGHSPTRMSPHRIAERYPAWNPDYFSDGFFNPAGGFVESGEVLQRLAEDARESGVVIYERHPVTMCTTASGRVSGVSANGVHFPADCVILAAGAWNEKLWPALAGNVRSTGHPVFHFRPDRPDMFSESVFPTFTADVSRTGYYGFPLSSEGVVKIGKHSLGTPTDPDGSREITAIQFRAVRDFLAEAIPTLADADLVYTRLCLYADTADEDFWIAHDPGCTGLFVAGGGSGHGFKFAPVLGDIVVDILEGKDNTIARKFRWRPEVNLETGCEAARCHDII